MSNYNLKISFSKEALTTIYAAGQKLVLVKAVEGDAGNPVAWLSTLPFEENTVEWKEEYMLYTARQEITSGAKISKLSEANATDGVVYDVVDGSFGNAHTSSTVGKNTYGVRNQMNQYPYLTVGMAVSATVNGEERKCNPVNAVVLPYNHTAAMSPTERVGIFLAANIDDGMVQTKKFSNMLTIEYTGNETEHTVRYDEKAGIFVVAD